MDEELRGILVSRIDHVCHELAQKGSFGIDDAANHIIAGLMESDLRRWREMRDHFARQGVIHFVNRVITQAKAADPAQRSLPGLESLPLLITSEGAAILAEQLNYERYQTEVRRLERKIDSYKYRRRKPENLDQDKRRLEEMKRFDPRFATYSANNPALTLREAKQIESTELSIGGRGSRRVRRREPQGASKK